MNCKGKQVEDGKAQCRVISLTKEWKEMVTEFRTEFSSEPEEGERRYFVLIFKPEVNSKKL